MLTDRPPPHHRCLSTCEVAAKDASDSAREASQHGDVAAAEVALADAEEALDDSCRLLADIVVEAPGSVEAGFARSAQARVAALWEQTQQHHQAARVELRRRERATR